MLKILEIINGLWIGKNLPELQRLSIESFVKNGHPYRLWAYKKYDNLPMGCQLKDASEIVPKEILNNWLENMEDKPNHIFQTFANYFRYKLIYERGGYWCDTDLVTIKPVIFDSKYLFTSISDIPLRQENKHLESILGLNGNIANGVFKSPKNSKFLKELIEEIEPIAITGKFPKMFGVWGTIAFSRKIVDNNLMKYKVPNLIPYGLSFAKKQYTDPNLPLPNGQFIHFYNYLNLKERQPNCLYDKAKELYA